MTTPRTVRMITALIMAVCWLGHGMATPMSAAASDRASIEAAYRKVCESASLHYVDGVLGACLPTYTVSIGEERQDLDAMRRQWAGLFSQSLRVQETISLQSFQPRDAAHATCTVHQVLELLTFHDGRLVTVTYDMEAHDDWTRTATGWLEASSHVVKHHATEAAASVPPLVGGTPK